MLTSSHSRSLCGCRASRYKTETQPTVVVPGSYRVDIHTGETVRQAAFGSLDQNPVFLQGNPSQHSSLFLISFIMPRISLFISPGKGLALLKQTKTRRADAVLFNNEFCYWCWMSRTVKYAFMSKQ